MSNSNNKTELAAKVGIGIQLLILIRSLGEYFRLKHFGGHPLTVQEVEPFITGCLIAAVCTAVSVMLFFWRKHTISTVVSLATIVILLIFKIVMIH